MTPPQPPEGYETLESSYDRRITPPAIKAAGGDIRAREDGYVLAYVWGSWRRASIKRRTQRALTVAYLGPDGNTWDGGESRVAPDRVAVRVGAKP